LQVSPGLGEPARGRERFHREALQDWYREQSKRAKRLSAEPPNRSPAIEAAFLLVSASIQATTIETMSFQPSSRRSKKSPPPGETGQEALYLRFLSEKQIPVSVKLRGGESVSGWIEYFDDGMIRLTREGKPNLFIYKHQIRTIREQTRGASGSSRIRNGEGPR
jgi:host factor-I protein